MKNQNLAGHLPLHQRAAFLEDNCDAVEEMSYLKKFTSDEIIEMKNRLSDVSIEVNDIDIEKKEIAKNFKLKSDPLVKEKKEILGLIKNKAILVQEQCFKFIDHEDQKVLFYNAIGDVVDERPILPSERQQTIFSISKSGTND